MQDSIVPGQLVVSVAGRDSGKFYLVIDEPQGNRLNVVDGEVRKVASPKSKNRKHLKACPEIALDLHERIRAGIKITDPEVRRALREIITNYT